MQRYAAPDEVSDRADAGTLSRRACRSLNGWKGRCASISRCSAAAGWPFSMRSRSLVTTRSSGVLPFRNSSSLDCSAARWCGGLSRAAGVTRMAAFQRQRELPKAWMQLPLAFVPCVHRENPMRFARRTRSAIGSRGRRAAVFIWRFSDCRSRNATRFARCMRSCGLWTTSRTKPAISNRSGGGWRAGERCWMRLQEAARTAMRFCPRWRIPSRGLKFRRDIFTI